MRRVGRTQIVPIVVLRSAEVVRTVVATAVAPSAGQIRRHDDAVANRQRLPVMIEYLSAHFLDNADIFVARNDRQRQSFAAVLHDIALTGMLVRAADASKLDPHDGRPLADGQPGIILNAELPRPLSRRLDEASPHGTQPAPRPSAADPPGDQCRHVDSV